MGISDGPALGTELLQHVSVVVFSRKTKKHPHIACFDLHAMHRFALK